MNKIKKYIKRIPATFVIIVAIVGCILVFINLNNIGEAVASTNGKIVGTAIGSYEGIINGTKEGAEAGTNAGLSATDIDVDIERSIEEIGKLEVLVAGVKLKNLQSIGENNESLYLAKGDAVFTVDLSLANISYSDDKTEIYIWIPEPSVELYLNEEDTELLARKSGLDFGVNAKDGYTAYINSMANMTLQIKETISNYDELMSEAQDAAISQISMLASTVCGDATTVHVQFK